MCVYVRIEQKMKFFIKDFFSIYDQILTNPFLRIWSHLQKKSIMENFIFCAVTRMYLILSVCLSVCLFFMHVYRNLGDSHLCVIMTMQVKNYPQSHSCLKIYIPGNLYRKFKFGQFSYTTIIPPLFSP